MHVARIGTHKCVTLDPGFTETCCGRTNLTERGSGDPAVRDLREALEALGYHSYALTHTLAHSVVGRRGDTCSFHAVDYAFPLKNPQVK
jgi:hypothetical protein